MDEMEHPVATEKRAPRTEKSRERERGREGGRERSLTTIAATGTSLEEKGASRSLNRRRRRAPTNHY
jgi:hypothetical protein